MNTIAKPQLAQLEEYFDQPELFLKIQLEFEKSGLQSFPVFNPIEQTSLSPFLKKVIQAYEQLLLVSFHSESRAVDWHTRQLLEISETILEVGKQFEYLVNLLFARFEGIYT